MAPHRETISPEQFVSRLLAPPPPGGEAVRARILERFDVTGGIDIPRVKIDWPVVIRDCVFRDTNDSEVLCDINVSEASVPALTLGECEFGKLAARHLEVLRGDLDLRGSKGTIDISGAHVRDDVHLESAKPRGGQCALRADGIHVGGDFVCRFTRMSRFTCYGKLSLDGAEISGSVHLEGARLNGPGHDSDSCAFSGEQLKVGVEFKAQYLESRGRICLVGLQVAGELNFTGANIVSSKRDGDNPTGVCLDRCHVGGSLFCDDSFSCIGGLKGIGSIIEGSAYFNGATLTSPDRRGQGRALELSRAHIGGILDLSQWTEPGLIRVSPQAPADLRRSYDPWSKPKPDSLTFACDGVVSLAYATVECRARIETGDIIGRKHLPADDDQDEVPIAMDLNRFRTQLLLLDGGPDPGGPPRDGARIDLTGATLGILLDYLIDLPNRKPECPIYPTILKGCTYNLIHESPSLKARLAWLETGSTMSRHTRSNLEVCYRSEEPSAQPYQQFADAAGRAGDDTLSREVLWRMNQDVNRTRVFGSKDSLPRALKWGWNWLTDCLPRFFKWGWNWFQNGAFGYGYRPGLATSWLLLLWGIGIIVFWQWPPAPAGSNRWGMSGVDHVTYPLDLMIPVVGFGQRSIWHPVGTGTQILAATLIAFGWIFSITVLAAITRIARRS